MTIEAKYIYGYARLEGQSFLVSMVVWVWQNHVSFFSFYLQNCALSIVYSEHGILTHNISVYLFS